MLIFKSNPLLLLLCATSTLFDLSSANAIPRRQDTGSSSYALETVHQFPNFTWIENLVSLVNRPSVRKKTQDLIRFQSPGSPLYW